MSIYIGNLPDEVTKDDLGDVLSEYGTVKQIGLPLEKLVSFAASVS